MDCPWRRAVCSVICLTSLIILLESLTLRLLPQHTTTELATTSWWKISASYCQGAALCFSLNWCTWLCKLDALRVDCSTALSSWSPVGFEQTVFWNVCRDHAEVICSTGVLSHSDWHPQSPQHPSHEFPAVRLGPIQPQSCKTLLNALWS